MIAQASSTTTTTAGPTTLTHIDGRWVLGAVVIFVIAAGLVVIAGRSWLENRVPKGKSGSGASSDGGRSPDRTLVRSWLAISLVGGLLIFCAAAFGVDDPSLRSTLLGGLVASAGAATAFYFASKSADQTRQDILNASLGTIAVPSLVGQTATEAQATMASSPFTLQLSPPNSPATYFVASQSPAGHSLARSGATIVATVTPPSVPTVTGVLPATGPAAGGTSVTVTGTGFTGATGVSFGSVPGTGVAVASDTQLTVTSPAGTSGAVVDVTVTTPSGASTTWPRDQFHYGL